jgi:parallel beta-helix repeat protein
LGVSGGLDSTAPSGVLIQFNTITHNNYAKVLSASGAGGIKFGHTANVSVRGNTVTDNDGTGIHFDSTCINPLIEHNIVANNTGGGGVAYEISVAGATIRNNIVTGNGIPDDVRISTAGIGSYASEGVTSYCNVFEIPNTGTGGANGMTIVASNRGYNEFSPYQYLMSTANSFHHNTVIWEAGAVGLIGYMQNDVAHQPNFFADNTPPDYNTYHLSSLSTANFVYDNNNTQANTRKTFTDFQAAGADVHGSADTNYTSGFPTVTITSPVDQSSFTNAVTLVAAASDKSGISRVEFYVDWDYQATVSGSPYTFNWTNGKAGTHTVAAMAYGNSGIRSCYAITLTKK